MSPTERGNRVPNMDMAIRSVRSKYQLCCAEDLVHRLG